MNATLARSAGRALTWKAVQLGGVKAIFLARTVVLARLVTPEDFGLLAVATVTVGILMGVTEFGMTAALVQHPDAEQSHYDAAWTVNLCRALCVSAVLLLATPVLATLLAEPRATDILRLLALKPLLDGSRSIREAALIRDLNYRRLALITLPAAAVETVVSIALATSLGVWALAIGVLTGAATGMCASYAVAPHRPRLLFDARFVRPLIQYGRWVFVTGMVSIAASSLTQLVISRRLGVMELGLYVLAARIAFLPHEIASQVVGDVAFSLYARVQENRVRVRKAFRSVLLGMSTALLPVYAILFCVAPRLVSDVLGERWAGTEWLVQLLSIVGIAGLFGDMVSPVFRGLGYPRWILRIELWQSSLVLLLLWTLTGHFGAPGAAAAWLVATGSSQVLSFILVRRLLPRPLKGLLPPLGAIVLASVVGASIALALIGLLPGLAGLVMALVAAAAATGMVLWFCDTRLHLGLRADLSLAFPRAMGMFGAVPGRAVATHS